MPEDIITMKQREIERLRIIQKVVDKHLKQVAAGELLGLCERQIRRLAAAVRQRGAKGVIHGNRGRVSGQKLGERIKAKILSLVKARYPDFGPTLAAETMAEKGEAVVSRETLRQWMIEAEIWQVRRRRKKIHTWRERKAHLGEMVQMDGSHHDWLEGRGPKMVLMGYIDDATGRAYGRFYDYEGVEPAMDSLGRYIGLYGLPQSVYLDKHSTYKTTRQADTDELLRGEAAKTQVERAMGELEIQVKHAHSPQAKGRIERNFRTLQDRLVKAMRLAGIKTREQANEFLESYWPQHNVRFVKVPREQGDFHRPLPRSKNLEDILCLKAKRSINNGFLIKWDKRMFVVQTPSRAMIGQKTEVWEHFDGRLDFRWQGRPLKVREVEEAVAPTPEKIPMVIVVRRKGKYTPPSGHPWRRNNPRLHHNCYLEKI
jgi:hypothetical protein